MLDIYSSSKSSSKTDYRNKINKLFTDDTPLNSIGHCDHGNRNFSSHQLNNTSNIVDFDILQSSLSSLPSGRDHFFLISAIN